MEFFEVIERRHSCRSYSEKSVEETKLNRILGVLDRTPSAGGLKAFSVVVISREEEKKRLSEAALGQEFVAEAPISLVFFAEPEASARKYGERGRRLYAIQDATIAAAYVQLAAVAQGLSCAWVGAFSDEEVKKICGAKENSVPIAIIPIGYGLE